MEKLELGELIKKLVEINLNLEFLLKFDEK
jgi:hypothetical protein